MTEEGWNVTALGRTGNKWHLHAVVLCAPPVAAAHVYAAIPNVDVINCPCLLLIERSRLVPAEPSCLRPLREKENHKGNISYSGSLYFDRKEMSVLRLDCSWKICPISAQPRAHSWQRQGPQKAKNRVPTFWEQDEARVLSSVVRVVVVGGWEQGLLMRAKQAVFLGTVGRKKVVHPKGKSNQS